MTGSSHLRHPQAVPVDDDDDDDGEGRVLQAEQANCGSLTNVAPVLHTAQMGETS